MLYSELCSHHHHLISEQFCHPKKKPCTHEQSRFISPHTLAWLNWPSAFCPCRSAHSGHFIWMVGWGFVADLNSFCLASSPCSELTLLISHSRLSLPFHLLFLLTDFPQCYFCFHAHPSLSRPPLRDLWHQFCDSQLTFFVAFLALLKCPLLHRVCLSSRSWPGLHIFLDSLFLFILCSGIACLWLQPSQFLVLIETFSMTEKYPHSFIH